MIITKAIMDELTEQAKNNPRLRQRPKTALTDRWMRMKSCRFMEGRYDITGNGRRKALSEGLVTFFVVIRGVNY